MDILGGDGHGYELARKLEVYGVWRSWLGDTAYSTLAPFLASPSSWETFMSVDDCKTRAQIELQLRVRALLFDKASVSLFLRPQSATSLASSSRLSVSKLNPSYLQLHGDDVYFTLDNFSRDRDGTNFSQQSRQDDLPQSWYSQFSERYSAPIKLHEVDRRTPIEMSAYLRLSGMHKRRRTAFVEDGSFSCNDFADNNFNSRYEEDDALFPETMFPWNCVPDTALSMIEREAGGEKREVYGVFDTLPRAMVRSPVLIGRLGIKPEYLNMEQCGSGVSGSGRKKKCVSGDHAMQLAKSVVGHMLADIGFEVVKDVSAEVLSQLLSSHICKLGRVFKLLADSYKKKCSAIELVKMFISYAGHSDLGDLVEYIDGKKAVIARQTQEQGQGSPSQMQLSQQSPLQQQQQVQWDRMQRRQQQSPLSTNKGSPVVNVKLESSPETTAESGSTFATVLSRHPRYQQLQQPQHQQIFVLTNFQAQSGSPFRSPSFHPTPINVGAPRALPVKVEGFQELMGTELIKSEMEDSSLTSTSK